MLFWGRLSWEWGRGRGKGAKKKGVKYHHSMDQGSCPNHNKVGNWGRINQINNKTVTWLREGDWDGETVGQGVGPVSKGGGSGEWGTDKSNPSKEGGGSKGGHRQRGSVGKGNGNAERMWEGEYLNAAEGGKVGKNAGVRGSKGLWGNTVGRRGEGEGTTVLWGK